MSIKTAITVAALAAAVPLALHFATRRAYPVPPPGGAVVVTGASTGIGRHAAETLADHGFYVCAGVRKNEDAEKIDALGKQRLHPIILDVTNQKEVDDAVALVEASGKPLVGLVNNAGIGGDCNPIEHADLEWWRQVFEVNVLGVVRVTKAFLPLLRKAQGRIINISSIAGFISSPFGASYCGSKWAIEALSNSLRVELAAHNVSVTVIEPAYVRTEIFNKAREPDHAAKEHYGHLIPDPAWHERCVEKAAEPKVVSDAILRALTDPYPPTRIVVANVDGRPAVLLRWLAWLLPDRALDRFMHKLQTRKVAK